MTAVQPDRQYLTILLGVNGGWVCRSNLGSSLLCEPDKKVMDLLKIGVRHDESRVEGVSLCRRLEYTITGVDVLYRSSK